MKSLLALSIGIVLVGCVSHPRALPTDSYLVDTERGLMCHVSECYYLDLVAPSNNELDVAEAFGLPVDVYSWKRKEFVELLLNPPAELYKVTKLSETEFQLPKNKATDAAFLLLDEEDLRLYRIGGNSNSL